MWPARVNTRLSIEIHRILHDVAERGDAIGYLSPPARSETDPWLEQTLAAVRAGNAALAVVLVEGVIQATGLWRRNPHALYNHCADLEKVMAHPNARGLGLGHLVVQALTDNARGAGLETLDLLVRGNNHGAIQLYEELGFHECGRRANVIEIGNERYDEVRMMLQLGRGTDVILRGSEPGGAGWSPRRRP
jgi:ribosomal protein S18 acetylase RimI-like enzyme